MSFADVNDKPQFSNVHGSLGVFGVEENTPIGTTVYVVSATDIDPGDTLTYSWSSSPTAGLSFFELGASSKSKDTIFLTFHPKYKNVIYHHCMNTYSSTVFKFLTTCL